MWDICVAIGQLAPKCVNVLSKITQAQKFTIQFFMLTDYY